MSETTEYMIGGLAHWKDSEGTWWYRNSIGFAFVATLAMMPYLEAIAAARREVETVTRERDEARAEARTLAITNETFVEDLATSRSALEDVRRELDAAIDAKAKLAEKFSEQWWAAEFSRQAVAACSIPYESLLSDEQSRKWIAPAIWAEIQHAVAEARRALAQEAGDGTA